jgi:hypothetical protein
MKHTTKHTKYINPCSGNIGHKTHGKYKNNNHTENWKGSPRMPETGNIGHKTHGKYNNNNHTENWKDEHHGPHKKPKGDPRGSRRVCCICSNVLFWSLIYDWLLVAWRPATNISCIFIKVCQWLVTGLWFSPVSSTNKSDSHVIAEILLKVALSTILYHNLVLRVG